jgi:hypothetical protein
VVDRVGSGEAEGGVEEDRTSRLELKGRGALNSTGNDRERASVDEKYKNVALEKKIQSRALRSKGP